MYLFAAQDTNVLTHGRLLQRVWGPERVGERRRCDRWRNEGLAVASSPVPMAGSGSAGQLNNPAG